LKRIFKYELKRLLLNRFYIGLLVINGLFAWYILTSDTIAGAAYTAPFSPWSFGSYLASVMPMTILAVLFLLTFFYSKNEKQVKTLTSATPVNSIHYTLIRMAVVALGFLFLFALIIGLSVYFYTAFFGFSKFSVFIVPVLVTVLPCFVFFVGAGYCAGRIHLWLLYALIPVSLMINFLHIPGAYDVFGKEYFFSFPLTLPAETNGEPMFVLSAMFIFWRVFYFTAGTLMLMYSVFRKSRR
jgi:ABC-2 type transport system permease protein